MTQPGVVGPTPVDVVIALGSPTPAIYEFEWEADE